MEKVKLTKELFREWVIKEVDKYLGITPSALALKIEYVFVCKGFKFTELRAIAEQTKQVYLTDKNEVGFRPK